MTLQKHTPTLEKSRKPKESQIKIKWWNYINILIKKKKRLAIKMTIIKACEKYIKTQAAVKLWIDWRQASNPKVQLQKVQNKIGKSR